MSSVRDQLAKLGVAYDRHPAADGHNPDIAAEWNAYLGSPKQQPDGIRPVENWRDFYLGDKPHDERVAFFEAEGKRGISTVGAWGLFLSMRRVIEKALADKVDSLLILEDDVVFHKDTIDLWPVIRSELPTDWQIFQLGAMQLHWEDNWISWKSQHLYKCRGSSIAAHAVALRRPAMQAIMDRSRHPDLPFDVGPLQEVKRLFRDKCFTAYPNLVIQDAKDSEIGMSKIFFDESKKSENIYRWKWDEYGPEVLRASNSTTKAKRPEPQALQDLTTTFMQPYLQKPGSVDRVIVVMSPDTEQDRDGFIALLSAQKDSGDSAPIVLIDDLAHVPALRTAGLAFEYVPDAATLERALPQGRDATLVLLRRLSILRRKWLPQRIIALGDGAHARLAAWRASPFEIDTPGSDLATDEELALSSE